MRIAVLRTIPGLSMSMDVYADGLIRGLKAVRPSWEIVELFPTPTPIDQKSFWMLGIQKYLTRYWRFPVAALKHKGIDVFHVVDHTDGHLIYWLKLFRKSAIITCHDLINLVDPSIYKGCARFPRLSMATWKFSVNGIKRADHTITVSSHTAKDVTRYLGVAAEQITAVPNAVESIFKPATAEAIKTIREKWNLPAETFTLLNVGSSNPRKNILTLLKVVANLRSRGLSVRVWKAGTDFNAEQLAFINEQQLSDRVVYVGRPNQAELIELYSAADVLVSPSLYEGFGLTVIEAMACGTPVIAANVTSLPEVAGEAAILIDPLDIEQIAKSIVKLQQNKAKRVEMAQQGLARAELFTWENTAEQVARAYENLTAKQQRQTRSQPSLASQPLKNIS